MKARERRRRRSAEGWNMKDLSCSCTPHGYHCANSNFWLSALVPRGISSDTRTGPSSMTYIFKTRKWSYSLDTSERAISISLKKKKEKKIEGIWDELSHWVQCFAEHEREGLIHVECFVHFRVLLRGGDKRSANGSDWMRNGQAKS